MCKSPSKFFSTKFLRYLIENHYISKKGIEYERTEVDALFFEKLEKLNQKYIKDIFKKIEHQPQPLEKILKQKEKIKARRKKKKYRLARFIRLEKIPF